MLLNKKTLYSVFNAAKKALFEPSYISAYSYPCKITHIIVYHPHTKNQDMNNDLSYRTEHLCLHSSQEQKQTHRFYQFAFGIVAVSKWLAMRYWHDPARIAHGEKVLKITKNRQNLMSQRLFVVGEGVFAFLRKSHGGCDSPPDCR